MSMSITTTTHSGEQITTTIESMTDKGAYGVEAVVRYSSPDWRDDQVTTVSLQHGAGRLWARFGHGWHQVAEPERFGSNLDREYVRRYVLNLPL